MNATECFAIRGVTMIDTIDSETGLTHIYQKTLDQVRAEVHTWADYSKAERMTIDEYCQSKADAQDTPVEWTETTVEKYDEMLGCVPPICYHGGPCGGFLVGEPYDHHAMTGRPRYTAFIHKGGKYYESSRPMQKSEFLARLT